MENIVKKTMTVKEFVEKYDAAESDIENTALLKGIIVRKYVPITDKCALCQAMVKSANVTDGKMDMNSVALYVSYIILGVVNLYTSIEIETKNAMEQYDMLQSRGLVDLITHFIGEDLKELQTVLNMCRDDFNARYYSTPGIVNRLVDLVQDTVGEVMKQLDSETIEGLKVLLKSMSEMN